MYVYSKIIVIVCYGEERSSARLKKIQLRMLKADNFNHCLEVKMPIVKYLLSKASIMKVTAFYFSNSDVY